MLVLLSVAVISYLFFSVVHFLCKNKKPFKRAFVSLFCGPVLLAILNIVSSLTGILVPLSQLSLAVSIALGIPGVSLLVLLSALL